MTSSRPTVARTPEVRRAPWPGRRQLVGAVVMVALGSFLPWLTTGVGPVSGARGPGLWTFYAAMLGLAATVVPLRRLALVQGAILAVTAVGIPIWQLVHVLALAGLGGWLPGPGLVLVLGGGVLAGVGTLRMSRSPGP